MTGEEMIRQIAEPILKQLEKIEKELGNQRNPQLQQNNFEKESEIGDGNRRKYTSPNRRDRTRHRQPT